MRKSTAKQWLDAERLEIIRGQELAIEQFGRANAGEAEIVTARGGHGREGVVLLLPILKVRIRDRAAIEVRLALVQDDQLLRMRKRQRVEQHPIYDGEDRRVRANAQRQRQHGDDGEAR